MPNLSGMQVSPGTVGITVEVVLESVDVCRGQAALGKAFLHGGDQDREINRFVAELQQHYMVSTGKSRATHYESVEAVTFAESFALPASQSVEQPLQFVIPELGRVTSAGRTEGWSIHAFAGISWAKDPWCRYYLDVLPEAPIQALDDALVKLGFTRIDNWAEGAIAGMNRRPPEHLAQYLDGIKFRCQVIGNEVAVSADVNWQERGVTDILKAIVHADHTTHQFTYQIGRPEAALSDFLGALGFHM